MILSLKHSIWGIYKEQGEGMKIVWSEKKIAQTLRNNLPFTLIKSGHSGKFLMKAENEHWNKNSFFQINLNYMCRVLHESLRKLAEKSNSEQMTGV